MGDYSVRLVHLVHFRYLCYNSIANYLRRKKLKRVGIFGLTAIIVLLSFGAYAQESGVRELSLKESVKLVLENNLDLKSAEYQLGLTEAEYEEAQINNLLNTSIVTLKTAELSLKRAQDSFEDTRKQLVLEDVISGYFQVVKAEQKIQIEEASLEESQQNLEMVKNKFSLGDANQLDVMQAEIGLSSAQLNLTQAVNDLTLAKMNFNQVLGLPLETQFKLTDTFSLETSEEILEDSIQKALDNMRLLKLGMASNWLVLNGNSPKMTTRQSLRKRRPSWNWKEKNSTWNSSKLELPWRLPNYSSIWEKRKPT